MTKITPFDAAYEDPSWAPDGRHLAASQVRSVAVETAPAGRGRRAAR